MSEEYGSGAHALPADVVGKVLQLIDQKQRVQSCSLVNRDWNKAAKLTFSRLTCRLGAAVQYQALTRWLHSNSSQISSIEVCSKLYHASVDTSELHTLHLPVSTTPQLQTLSLEFCRLQPISTALAPSDTAVTTVTGASLAALTALKTLKFEGCVINIDDLGRCTTLQHLHLSPAVPANDCESSTAAVDARASVSFGEALALALQQLQQLTFLSINRPHQPDMHLIRFDSVFNALSSLQQLQVFEVGSYVNMPGPCFAQLPISLRKLKIASYNFGSKSALPLDAAPHLQRLSNLQHLHLDRVWIEDPELLLSCTQLTGLDLTCVNIEGGDAHEDEDWEAVMINLLEVIQALQQLQHLCLSDTLEHEIHQYASYAAVTASSHLTSLDISSCGIACAAMQHIFASSQPCRGLLEVSLTSQLLDCGGSFQLLASCCPALQTLYITSPLIEYVGQIDLQGISALSTLTALTTLSIDGVQFSDDAVASIAQCQQLKDLELVVNNVSLAGLQHLTRLTGLTGLLFRGRCQITEEPDGIDLTNQAAADRPPDVHQQLQRQLEQQRQKQQQRQAAHVVADD